MPLYAYIFYESPVRLWGLTSRQRLARVLKRAGVTDFVENLESVPAQGAVLVIRGDYLYDERVIDSLIKTTRVILQAGPADAKVPVAAIVPTSEAPQALTLIKGESSASDPENIRFETTESLCSAYNQRLRKSDPPFVLPINQESRRDLEKRLFNSSYKGVTDLITKWVWPRPAHWCTGICARHGIRPNYVTFAGLVLVIIAGVLFARGQFGWGLLAGWLMTFLDTVDGKLARVTITSSRFGHLFDHLIDLIHPPVWYVAWGLGLSHVGMPEISLNLVLWIIIVGYIVGRLAELAFTLSLGSFGIFCWRPLDSYFRLITARRNPNLIFLTAGAAILRPDLGLLAVAFWTALTSLFMIIRLAMAGIIRLTSGPLHSWLLDIDQGTYERTLAARIFGSREPTQSAEKHA